MPNTWKQELEFYMSRIDDQPASFVVDVIAPRHAPLVSHPLVLIFTVPLLRPTENGLRGAAELNAMGELEDNIVANLGQAIDSIYVGRVVHDSETTFYFYLPRLSGEELERIPEHAGNLGNYQMEWSVEEDEEWGYCTEFLAPDVFSHQLISNRRLLNHMREAGDQVNVAREVDHFAYFDSQESAEKARKALQTAGFEVQEVRGCVENDHRWDLGFRRLDVPGNGGADQFVEQIFDLLDPFEGIYDGWGTPMVQG